MVGQMNNHLLPPNSTQQERAISEAIARAADFDVPIHAAWNPWTCPEPLLPWLAWTFSVDEWQPGWTTDEKRAVIANALYIHEHKGTLAALKRAVEPLGYIIKIIPWRDEPSTAPPYSFRLEVGVSDKGINETIYQQIERLIEAYRNVRSYMRALTLKADVSGAAKFAAAMMSGVDTVVYPYVAEDMQSTAFMYWAAAEQTADTVAVFPAI